MANVKITRQLTLYWRSVVPLTSNNLPSILLAQTKHGISGLYSRNSLSHRGKFLYVTLRVESNTW